MMPPERRRSLIFPREHGAWGMLFAPLAIGAVVGLRAGGRAAPAVPLAIAVSALFCLRTPVESWMGSTPVKARSPEELRLVRRAALILASVSAAALVWLFWNGRNSALLWIGLIAAAAFLCQAALRHTWRKARTAAQVVGAAGLTSVAPAAWYVVAGNLNRAAWSLWILNLLFAAGQIHFVQLRIRAAHAKAPAERWRLGRAFAALQAATMALLLAGCAARLFSWWVGVAFLPVLFRGFAWYVSPFRPLDVHALGRRELLHVILFAALLTLAG